MNGLLYDLYIQRIYVLHVSSMHWQFQIDIGLHFKFYFLQKHPTDCSEKSFLHEHLQSSLLSSEIEVMFVQLMPKLLSLLIIHPHWFGEGNCC